MCLDSWGVAMLHPWGLSGRAALDWTDECVPPYAINFTLRKPA